jgi:hypothetical protein
VLFVVGMSVQLRRTRLLKVAYVVAEKKELQKIHCSQSSTQIDCRPEDVSLLYGELPVTYKNDPSAIFMKIICNWPISMSPR